MINRTILFLWTIVFILMVALSGFFIKTILQSIPQNDYVLSHGVFDFSDINIFDQDIIEIRGEVEFYQDTLLSQEDFERDLPPTPTAFMGVPSKWNHLRTSSDTPAGHGYGTYHFKIIVPEKCWYGIKIKDFKLAYSLSIDGNMLGGSGKVGKTKEEMIPSRYQKEFYFLAETDTLEVLIQVSNFHHRNGGATGTILFGHSENIIKWKARQVGIEAFLIGLLFILFIYHLALFSYRRKDKSILYFSLLCLSMFVRTGYIGERLFLEVFSFLGWNISTKIEYISFMAIPIFTTLFVNNLFPKEIPKWLVWFVSVFAIICISLVLFLNPTAYSYTSLYIQYILGPATALIVVMLFIASLRRRAYAIPVFLGYSVFFLLSVFDAISYATFMDSIYLMPAGLFVVTLSQGYVLAKKSSSAYAKAENLAEELNDNVNNLENLVQERTREIQSQKEEIEQQKKSIESKAEELRSSNENLLKLAEFKTNMTNMMVHDLKNPLNNIIGFASLPKNIDEFKNDIHSSGWKMLNLIDNFLDLEKNESSEIKLNKTEIDLGKVVNDAFNNTRYMLETSKLDFHNEVGENIRLQADEDIINRVISNVFSNAAKYARREGFIRVSCEDYTSDEGQKFAKVLIYNDGDPIPADKLEAIFEKYNQVPGSNEAQYHSSGIGLAFCKLAINAHGGKIAAHSGEEYGVTIWFTLPASN